MYELKTKPTNVDPLQVISKLSNEKKRKDAKILLAVFQKASRKPPVVWGEKLIGYGICRYQYPTGHSGEIYAAGFSVTNRKITLHLYLDDVIRQNYLSKLGKTTSGKSCVYINKLSDIDISILEKMIQAAITYMNHNLT